MEGRKDTKVQQDESYHSTGDLAALYTSCHTGFAPDTHRVPDSHASTGPRSVSRPCIMMTDTIPVDWIVQWGHRRWNGSGMDDFLMRIEFDMGAF